METLGHPTFVIALRFKNIVAFALGKMDAWGLNTEAMHWDDWDYVHITDLELPAVSAAKGRGCASLGGGCGFCRLGRGYRGSGACLREIVAYGRMVQCKGRRVETMSLNIKNRRLIAWYGN